MNNFLLIVLDGVGIGAQPDSVSYGDENSNTLKNIAEFIGGLNLPNLQKMGLGNIHSIKGINPNEFPIASFGKLREVSKGKDSTSGHWELAGLKIDFYMPVFPNGFPERIIQLFLDKNNLKGVLGNKSASGTDIIRELGDEHIRTGYPIIYTSVDSVFQIAAHENVFPLERLYSICKKTRNEILIANDSIGRVIARPFIGENGNYKRTSNRKDFSLNPPGKTILDYCAEGGITTIGIGKVNDLFNYRGIIKSINTISNENGMREVLNNLIQHTNSFIFANLVDFDVLFGHRNDPIGFAKALEEFDLFIPKLIEKMDSSDHLIITADHGNDPTTPGTDHSREFTPLIYFNKNRIPHYLGIRNTFSDVAATIADHFNITVNSFYGKSFYNE